MSGRRTAKDCHEAADPRAVLVAGVVVGGRPTLDAFIAGSATEKNEFRQENEY